MYRDSDIGLTAPVVTRLDLRPRHVGRISIESKRVWTGNAGENDLLHLGKMRGNGGESCVA